MGIGWGVKGAHGIEIMVTESEIDRVRMLEEAYGGWVGRCGVLPWPAHPDMVAKRFKGKHAHISQHRTPLSGKMR